MKVLFYVLALACHYGVHGNIAKQVQAGRKLNAEAFRQKGHEFIALVQEVVGSSQNSFSRALLVDAQADGTQYAYVLRESDNGDFSSGLGITDGQSTGNIEAINYGVAAAEIDNKSGDTKAEALQAGGASSDGADATSVGGAVANTHTETGKALSIAATLQLAQEGNGSREATANAITFAVASDQATAGAQAGAVALNNGDTNALAEGLAEGIHEAKVNNRNVNRVAIIAEIIAELLPFVEETGVTADLILAVQSAVFKGGLSGDKDARDDLVEATAEGIAIAVSRGETEAVAVALVEASAAGGDVAKAAALAISIAISEQGCYAIAAAYSRAQQIAAIEGKSRELEQAITQTGTITSCEGFCVTPARVCTEHQTCCTAFRDQHECISGKCTACGDIGERACKTTGVACNFPYRVDRTGVCKKRVVEPKRRGTCLALKRSCSLSTQSCCAGSLCLLKKCHACGTEGGFCCFSEQQQCGSGMACVGGICRQVEAQVADTEAVVLETQEVVAMRPYA